MIVGFAVVLLAVAGSIGILVYVVRAKRLTYLEQQRRQIVALNTGSGVRSTVPGLVIQLQPVGTFSPADEDEGKLRECPICFEETKQNADWLLLPCRHGICNTCYSKLVQELHKVTTCPFCRMPLLEPAPPQMHAEERV